MNSSEPILRVQDGCKDWIAGKRRIPILRRINFAIHPGDSVAVMGPSGSGKSTLLHILGFLTPLDSGEIWCENRRISLTQGALDYRLRRQIGFVFQDFKLIPNLNVLENVCMPLAHRGVWPSRQKKLAIEQLERVGLAGWSKHMPNQLSGGEMMRVAIARAMIQNPRILLADEPTGSLDSETGKHVARLLKQGVAGGRALVLATHNAEVAGMADCILHLKDGCLGTTTT